jgi:hypothetical protein
VLPFTNPSQPAKKTSKTVIDGLLKNNFLAVLVSLYHVENFVSDKLGRI